MRMVRVKQQLKNRLNVMRQKVELHILSTDIQMFSENGANQTITRS